MAGLVRALIEELNLAANAMDRTDFTAGMSHPLKSDVCSSTMAQRMPVVVAGIEQLGQQLESIAGLVQTLEARLGSVLRNDPRPTAGSDCLAVETRNVAIAERLACLAGVADQTIFSLREILERLEV